MSESYVTLRSQLLDRLIEHFFNGDRVMSYTQEEFDQLVRVSEAIEHDAPIEIIK